MILPNCLMLRILLICCLRFIKSLCSLFESRVRISVFRPRKNAYDVTHNTGAIFVARQSDVFNIFHKKPKGLQGDVAI